MLYSILLYLSQKTCLPSPPLSPKLFLAPEGFGMGVLVQAH